MWYVIQSKNIVGFTESADSCVTFHNYHNNKKTLTMPVLGDSSVVADEEADG